MQQTYSCPNCGAPVAFGVKSCPNCGTPLSWPTQQQMQPPPVYQQQQPQQQWQYGYGEQRPERKKTSPWLIGCLGLLGVMVLFAGLICVIDTGSEGTPPTTPPATPPATSPPEATQEPAIKITCEQLTQECMDNEVAWDQKYKGKVVEVSGAVKAIDYEYVTLDSGLFLTDMHCSLREGQESQLAQLVKGEWVGVRGTCESCGIFGVRVEDCVLVSASPEMAGKAPENVIPLAVAGFELVEKSEYESPYLKGVPMEQNVEYYAYSMFKPEVGSKFDGKVKRLTVVVYLCKDIEASDRYFLRGGGEEMQVDGREAIWRDGEFTGAGGKIYEVFIKEQDGELVIESCSKSTESVHTPYTWDKPVVKEAAVEGVRARVL